MIVAESLGKEFRDKKRGVIRAVENLTFCCSPGQVYGLLGANGAGKTTALRLLATILTPTSGTARVAGFDIRREPQKARQNLGFLSTATALYGRLTALEVVEYFGCLLWSGSGERPPAHPRAFRAAGHQCFSRSPLRGSLHRHEAAGFHSSHPGSRPAGDDLRRTDLRPGRHQRQDHREFSFANAEKAAKPLSSRRMS